MTRNPLNSYGGEWKNEFQFGEKDRFFSEYYQPLNRRLNYFGAPYIEFLRQDINIYEDGQDVAKFRQRTYTSGLDFGMQLGHWGSFRIGNKYVDGRVDVKIGNPDFETYDYNRGGISTSFAYDTMDDIVFPNNGIKADLACDIDMKSFRSDDSLESYRLDIALAKTWYRYTLLPWISFNTVSEDNAPIQYETITDGNRIYIPAFF